MRTVGAERSLFQDASAYALPAASSRHSGLSTCKKSLLKSQIAGHICNQRPGLCLLPRKGDLLIAELRLLRRSGSLRY